MPHPSQLPSNTWLIKFKDPKPPSHTYPGTNDEEAAHYIKNKLRHLYKEINETATVESGVIDCENIYVVQNSDDVDEYIFYAYINTSGKPFGMHFFNPSQK